MQDKFQILKEGPQISTTFQACAHPVLNSSMKFQLLSQYCYCIKELQHMDKIVTQKSRALGLNHT